MTAVGSIRRVLQLLGSERGFALPTAMFATVASLGLASAAVMASVDVQQGSKRDSGSKSAIAAADAGANVAMMRINREASELGTEPCLDGEEPELDGWCPPVSGEIGGAEYSYRVSQAGVACGEFDLCAVATGTAGGVTRRVLITFNEGPGVNLGGGEDEEEEEESGGGGSGGGVEGLIGKDAITLSGNADIRVNIGTDGDIVSSGNTSICGDIRHGIGKKWTKSGNTSQCSGHKITEGNLDLPPVTSFMPATIATKNSNGRITKCNNGLPLECQADTYNGTWSSTSPLNPSNRRISLSGNTTLTLGGGDYWLCQLSLSGNSQLIMADGAHVRFFFDTPENCGVSNQISLSGNNRIAATGYQPGDDQFDMPGFYLIGSPTIATTVSLSGNYSTTNEFVLYGPNTNVSISGNATFKGVIAGKTVEMSGNGRFENDDGFELSPDLNPWFEEEEEGSEEEEGAGALAVFTPQFYFECTGAEGATPNASC